MVSGLMPAVAACSLDFVCRIGVLRGCTGELTEVCLQDKHQGAAWLPEAAATTCLAPLLFSGLSGERDMEAALQLEEHDRLTAAGGGTPDLADGVAGLPALNGLPGQILRGCCLPAGVGPREDRACPTKGCG